MPELATYPATPSARDRFILARRPARPAHDPWRHQGVLVEQEPAGDGRIVDSATVFLTGRECPWRCVMCDLWQFTHEDDTPPGAIAAQVAAAVEVVRTRRDGSRAPTQIKLYNAGSFFDPRAVPEADYDAIAAAVRAFDSVVVESHPALVGPRLTAFLAACRHAAGGDGLNVEVAMGLETAHPEALARLNKRTSLTQFAAAAAAIHEAGASLRAFVLVGVPFVPLHEQADWTQRSVAMARACGARVVSLIPLRRGNGAVEALEQTGDVVMPRLVNLEDALDVALEDVAAARADRHASPSHVIADTWDLDALLECDTCHTARVERLRAVNLTQRVQPRVSCTACDAGGRAS